MSLTRRELMKYGLSASGALLLPLQFPKKALADVTSLTTPDPWPTFTTPLSIPDVLKPYSSDNTTDYYEIVLSKQQRKIQASDTQTYEFWGYNGISPGPTIKQTQNRIAQVNFYNTLGQTTIGANGSPQQQSEDIRAVIHLHGMASLPEYDGYAEDYILPNQYKTYIYPNDRPATFWYHDHQLARTARNVGMGLAGMWIVQDDTECQLKLPTGKYEVPLIFQNPPFTYDRDKTLTLINGVYQPLMQVDNCKYRFRLLNATATHVYNLVLVRPDPNNAGQTKDCDNALTIIGTDGGLRGSPAQTTTLNFVMADRYEVIIDFSAFPLNSKVALVDRANSDESLICFEISNSVQDSSVVPSSLRPFTPVPDDVASPSYYPDAAFKFDFNGVNSCSKNGNNAAAINGLVWDKNIIQAYPPLSQASNQYEWQKWRLVNNTQATHPVHIHLLDFQILRRLGQDGKEVPLAPYEQNSWKDVFNLGPGETLDIAGQFGPHVGKYMMHCHNLKHEDCDMMTNFEVIDMTGKQQPLDPITGAPAVDIPTGYQPKTPSYQPYSVGPCSPS
jgi:FtsP/CotA-like multicopper oxidase with cupredoxin domain